MKDFNLTDLRAEEEAEAGSLIASGEFEPDGQILMEQTQ